MTNTNSDVSQITTFGNGTLTLDGLNDGTDKLHSGILKALFAVSTGNYVFSLDTNGITQSTGSTYTRFTVDNNIVFYLNGARYEISGTNLYVDLTSGADSSTDRYDFLVLNSFTDATCDTTSGDATVTHDTNSSIVANLHVMGENIPSGTNISSLNSGTSFELSANATASETNATLRFFSLAIREGSVSGSDSNVGELQNGDIPIALIKVVAGTGNNITDRPIQMYTANHDERNMELYYNDGVTPRLGVGISDPAGTLHIKNTNTDYAALFETTDDSASAAPDVALYRNSATPANGDDLGHLIWRGVEDAGGGSLVRGNYADIFGEIQVATSGSESGKLHLRTKKAGTMNKVISLTATEVVINEDGNSGNKDINFRVESTGNDNMLFVDSGNDRVGIGTNSPEAPLHVESSGTGVVVRIESTDTGGGDLAPDVVLHRNTSVSSEELAHMKFTGLNTTPAEHLYADMYAGINTATAGNESGEFFIRTLHTGNLRRRLDITKNEVVINENSIDSDFRVESDDETHMIFVDAANDKVGIANSSPSATLDVTGSIASDTSVTAPEITAATSLTTQGLMFQVPETLDQTTSAPVMSGVNSIVYVFDISNAPSATPPGNSNLVELPDPTTVNHAVFTIRNVGSNPIDIQVQGGQPIDGGLTTHALVSVANTITLPIGEHVTVQAVTDSVAPLVTGYYIIGN